MVIRVAMVIKEAALGRRSVVDHADRMIVLAAAVRIAQDRAARRCPRRRTSTRSPTPALRRGRCPRATSRSSCSPAGVTGRRSRSFSPSSTGICTGDTTVPTTSARNISRRLPVVERVEVDLRVDRADLFDVADDRRVDRHEGLGAGHAPPRARRRSAPGRPGRWTDRRCKRQSDRPSSAPAVVQGLDPLQRDALPGRRSDTGGDDPSGRRGRGTRG